MQPQLTAGDSLLFSVAGGSYPASSGWVLTHLLVPRVGTGAVTIPSTASGDDFEIAVPATITAGWAAGEYSWFRRVERAGEKYTIEQGQLTIRPNPESLSGTFDGRSQAVKALEDLKAARATWINSQGRVSSYEIAGRKMVFRAAIEIDREIRYWELEVAREINAQRAAAGLRTGGRFYVRVR